jgi:hypothetical protein
MNTSTVRQIPGSLYYNLTPKNPTLFEPIFLRVQYFENGFIVDKHE